MADQIIRLTNGSASTLTKCTPVRVDDSGECQLAGNSDATQRRVIGLVRDGIDSGESGRVVTSGRLAATAAQWDAVTGSSGGLIPNRAYYLSGTPGRLTEVADGPLIGVALSTYVLALQIGDTSGDSAASASEAAETEERVFVLDQRFRALVMWLVSEGFEPPTCVLGALED